MVAALARNSWQPNLLASKVNEVRNCPRGFVEEVTLRSLREDASALRIANAVCRQC